MDRPQNERVSLGVNQIKIFRYDKFNQVMPRELKTR